MENYYIYKELIICAMSNGHVIARIFGTVHGINLFFVMEMQLPLFSALFMKVPLFSVLDMQLPLLSVLYLQLPH